MRTRGHYKTNRVIFVTLGLLVFVGLAGRARVAVPDEAALRRQLGALLLMGTTLLALDSKLLYVEATEMQDSLQMLLVLALVASAALAVLVWRGRAQGLRQGLMLIVLVALVVVRPLVLWVSPAPHIDVFTTTDAAVDFLLQGLNPYSQVYPDIYDGQYEYAPGMAYWPGTVLFATFGKWAFGDLRSVYVLGDLLSAAAMAALAVRRSRLRLETGLLGAAVWLAFPVGLFVLEQAWVDPLILAALLWAAVALDAERFGAAGVLLGVATCIKQPAALAALSAALVVLAVRPKAGLQLIVAGGAVGAVVLLPFVLWDADGLWRMTIVVPLGQPPRLDALTFVALAQREWGVMWPGGASTVIYVAALIGGGLQMIRVARADRRVVPAVRWLTAMSVLYAVVFLFGKQAFCNYWALTAGLVLAARLALSTGSDTEPLYG